MSEEQNREIDGTDSHKKSKGEEKREKRLNRIKEIIATSDCTPHEIYKSIPMLGNSMVQTGRCFLCDSKLSNKTIKVEMANEKNVITGEIPGLYCSHCGIGFSTVDICASVKKKYPGYCMDYFFVGRKLSKVCTLEAVWGMINSGNVTAMSQGRRKQILDQLVSNPQKEDEISPARITIGSIVVVFDKEYAEEITYSIVDTTDANAFANKISDESPLGQALLGKKKGDVVKVNVGNHCMEYEVLAIKGVLDEYREKALLEQRKGSGATIKEKRGVTEIKDVSPKHFVTRVNVFKCTNKNHQLIDIRCRIRIVNRNGAITSCVVPGAYCKDCNKYFLLEEEYKKIKRNGFTLFCNVVEQDYWTQGGKRKGDFHLNQESMLHMMGYNVNAQAKLTEVQRRKILELIVDERILTVAEIRSHIQWLIERSKNKPSFQDARSKWESDCNYIAKYKASNRKCIEVEQLTVRHYQNRK